MRDIQVMWPYIRRFRAGLTAGIVMVVGNIAITVMLPYVLRQAIDDLQSGVMTYAYLMELAGVIVLLAIMQGGIVFARSYLINRNGQHIEKDIRSQLFATIQRLDRRFFEQTTTGDLLVRTSRDITNVRQMFNQVLTYGTNILLYTVVLAILLAVTNWLLTIFVFLMLFCLSVTMLWLGYQIKHMARASQRQLATITNLVHEVLSNMRIIKAYLREDQEQAQFQATNTRYLQMKLRSAKREALLPLLVVMVVHMTIALLLWIGGQEIVADRLTIGTFTQFNLYVFMLATTFAHLARLVPIVQTGMVSLRRIVEILRLTPSSDTDRPGVVVQPTPAGTTPLIAFEDISFRYAPSAAWSLRQISFNVFKGQNIAIVGPTGSGKSSIATLLARFYPPDEGRIVFHGSDLQLLPVETVRAAIVHVPQHTLLFSMSLGENIAFGQPDAPEPDIMAAVQMAGLAPDIALLPAGLQTPVGERGITLSGGQKQRTALARALLPQANILILDDCLSHLDVHTQNYILHQLKHEIGQRAAIWLTSRPGVARHADYIIVLEEGRIVEQGTPDELLLSNGRYAQRYQEERAALHRFLSIEEVLTGLPEAPAAAGTTQPTTTQISNDPALALSLQGKNSHDPDQLIADRQRSPQAIQDAFTGTDSAPAGLQRLLPYLKPHWRLCLAALLLIAIIAGVEASSPFLVKSIIDQHMVPHQLAGADWKIGIYVLVTLLLVASRYLHAYTMQYLGQAISNRLRIDLFSHTIAQNMQLFDRHPIGQFTTRIIDDVESISTLFSKGIVSVITNAVVILTIVITMMFLNWQLTVNILLVAPFLIVAAQFYRKRLTTLFRKIRNQAATLNAYLLEQYHGMAVVQLFNGQARQRNRFEHHNAAYTETTKQKIYADNLFAPAISCLLYLTWALLVLFGGFTILGDTGMTVGLLVAFLYYIERTFTPIANLAEDYGTLRTAIVASERIFTFLDYCAANQATVRAAAFGPAWRVAEGRIAFRNVTFRYTEEKTVLKDVSFTIEAGQQVAIIGHTGAGKTTITNLLCRFYECHEGAILIDGHDIRSINPVDLRRSITLVPQDIALIQGSIADNIRYGNTTLSMEQVCAAAELVGADRFITHLPGGYAYQLEAQGRNISVGQRQQICFARAIACNPQAILVLDEATVSMDYEAEEGVQHALGKLLHGRTSIIIAHRLPTIRNADIIMVLERGQVVEMGLPDELLRSGGRYAQLVHAQLTQDGEITARHQTQRYTTEAKEFRI